MEILHTISNFTMATWQYIVKNKLSILYLIVLIVVFYLIYGLVLIMNNKKYIQENWNQYKCKPYAMPFSNLFSSQNPLETMNDCLWINFRTAFGILIQPINYAFKILTKWLGDAAFTLNKFRNMAAFIREMFQKMVGEVFEKLTTSMSTLQFYTEKFRNLMKKQFAMFQLIYYYLETMRATFDSLFNGPLPVMLLFLMIFGILTIFIITMCGLCAASIPFFSWFVACPICLICFEPTSQIKIGENEYMDIQNIQLGDTIYPNQKVLGKLVFNLDYDYPVYNLSNEVFVSGSHLYYISLDSKHEYNPVGHPARISDFANKLEESSTRKLICLATSKNYIHSANHIFADYTEVSNPDLDNEWNRRVLASLNNILDYTDYPIADYVAYPGGFLEPIPNTNPPDNIQYLIEENDVQLYDYLGIICSGNNIVWENNHWIRVSTSPKAKSWVGEHNNRIYHIKTNIGTVKIGDIYFRDFLETNDTNVYEWWNKVVPELIQTISV